jgi:hypothetical protein
MIIRLVWNTGVNDIVTAPHVYPYTRTVWNLHLYERIYRSGTRLKVIPERINMIPKQTDVLEVWASPGIKMLSELCRLPRSVRNLIHEHDVGKTEEGTVNPVSRKDSSVTVV